MRRVNLWRKIIGPSPTPLMQPNPKRQVFAADVEIPSDKEKPWLSDAQRFGNIRVEVVGESHYQPAIRKACNWDRKVREKCRQILGAFVPVAAGSFEADVRTQAMPRKSPWYSVIMPVHHNNTRCTGFCRLRVVI